MLEANPFFSIILPTYNRAATVEVAIKSTLSQQFSLFELIIIDDGSTDNTEEIVHKFNDTRIRYYKTENRERGAARNFGIKKARGNYINFLDSDDYFLPNHLQEAYNYIKKNDAHFFIQGYQILNIETGTIIYREFPKKNPIKSLSWNNVLTPICAFVRQDIMNENLFDEDFNFKVGEDLYIFFSIAAKHGIFFNETITSTLVNHSDRTMRQLNPQSVLYCKNKMIDLLIKNKPFVVNHADCLNIIAANQNSLIAITYSELGDTKNALLYLQKAIKKNIHEIYRKRFFIILIKTAFQLLQNIEERFHNYIHEDYWRVIVTGNNIDDIINKKCDNIRGIEIEYDAENYIADPFIYKTAEGKLNIIAENYNFDKQIGTLVLLELNANNKFVKTKDIALKARHISYPIIINYNGEQYCTIESSADNKLVLYKLSNNNELVKIKTLIENIKVIDPSIFHDGYYYWLAFTDGDKLTNGNLLLYYASDLLGEWLPHKGNPVKTTKYSSRGAGQWFTFNNNIYRPAQNCTQTYGGSIVINKINKLTPEIFAEEIVREIKPDFITIENDSKKNNIKKGIHTINSMNEYSVWDIKTTHLSLTKPIKILLNKFKK